jgi:hypothetical protein
MNEHFKNKRCYWILMPPFLITFIVLSIFLPNDYRHYSPFIIIIFWIVYYSLSYYANKKNNRKNLENSS